MVSGMPSVPNYYVDFQFISISTCIVNQFLDIRYHHQWQNRVYCKDESELLRSASSASFHIWVLSKLLIFFCWAKPNGILHVQCIPSWIKSFRKHLQYFSASKKHFRLISQLQFFVYLTIFYFICWSDAKVLQYTCETCVIQLRISIRGHLLSVNSTYGASFIIELILQSHWLLCIRAEMCRISAKSLVFTTSHL